MLHKYIYAIFFLATILISCDNGIFEKHPTYSYEIKNNTNVPLTVQITSPIIITTTTPITYTIDNSATRGVWTDTEYHNDSWVYNRERANKLVTGFRIESLSKGNAVFKSNPNNTKRWSYNKKKAYEATYTLTVEETDF